MKIPRFFRTYRNAREKQIADLLSREFGLKCRSIEYYAKALRHKSAARNIYNRPELSNERLEFLGDAILDAVVADYLYAQYPQAEEGELTKMKSRIVSRANLNRMAREMHIDAFIETDAQAMQATGSISGNAIEALFGAIYLDHRYKKAREVILNVLEKHGNIDHVDEREVDFKSRLYEEAHRLKVELKFNTHLLKEQNGVKTFASRVVFDGKPIGSGEGSSKKKAEQAASREGLQEITGRS